MKRAPTKADRRIYRAVAGAVKNVAHHHPAWKINSDMVHSIAKRALGTLAADWPDVLADRKVPSDQGGSGVTSDLSRLRSPGYLGRKGGGVMSKRPLPLHRQLSALIGPAKSAGRFERAEALIEVLRLIRRK